jgi:hypothetical protein
MHLAPLVIQALLLNVAQTATGSGTKRLMDLQVGGFSLFSIGNTGTAHNDFDFVLLLTS